MYGNSIFIFLARFFPCHSFIKIIFVVFFLISLQVFTQSNSEAGPQKKLAQEWVYNLTDYNKIRKAHLEKALGRQEFVLAEMVHLGLPVPPGFIIKQSIFDFYKKYNDFPKSFTLQIENALKRIDEEAKKALNDSRFPLLLTLKTSENIKIPEGDNVILYIGLNDKTTEELKSKTGKGYFAYDNYRKFIEIYGRLVAKIDMLEFDKILQEYKNDHLIGSKDALAESDLHKLIELYKQKILKVTGKPFPQELSIQLLEFIKAILEKHKTIYPHDLDQQALIIQYMVFGNIKDLSGVGEAFTRNPFSGERALYGFFIKGDKGAKIITGTYAPQPLTQLQKKKSDQCSFQEEMPSSYKELIKIGTLLEKHFKDMQHIEFVIQKGKLWVLDSKKGRREPEAALKISLDLVKEGIAKKEDIIKGLDPTVIQKHLHSQLIAGHDLQLIGRGVAASPGASSGKALLSTDENAFKAIEGEKFILVLRQTTPEDIYIMSKAEGILTSQGGMSSHAAVVARGMGKPCVVGCRELIIDKNSKSFSAGNSQIREGDIISVDGTTGNIFRGKAEIKLADVSNDLKTILGWADHMRRLKVKANAETIQDVQAARRFGAEGIGLCRTEHMFFEKERLPIMQKMIIASSEEARKKELTKLLQFQREDFYNILVNMNGLPVTIRLLDPPLHEFLPVKSEKIDELANELGIDVKEVKARIEKLHEINPMLGNRGCRLGITIPEIYEMQVQAIFEALTQLEKAKKPYQLEIMVPFVVFPEELSQIRKMIDRKAEEIRKISKAKVTYKVGTMIELPQAALQADKIAAYADFISFGTNDLTQTTLGISRDDASSFLKSYQKKGIIDKDPFVSLNGTSVTELISIACHRAKATKPNIKIGVCGEQACDPSSINFFESMGLDYVSCSPFRLLPARLAAAQASLKTNQKK